MWERTTEVEFSARLPEHDTFAQAAAAGERRASAGRRDTENVKDSSIVDYAYTGRVLSLILSSQKVLLIFVSESGVDWEVVEARSYDVGECAHPAECLLRFPSGREYHWRWKGILDALLGKALLAVSPSETTVSLYVRDCPDLLFTALVARATGERILFFEKE
jgi:hypothetical protein